MRIDEDEIQHHIEKLSDDDLVDMLKQPHEYTQYALKVARKALGNRGKGNLIPVVVEQQPSPPSVSTKSRLLWLGALSVKKGSRLAFFRIYFITFLIPYLITLAMGGEAARDFPMIGMIVSPNRTIARAVGYFLLAFLAAFGIVAKSYIPYGFFMAILLFEVLIWFAVGWSFRGM